MAFSLQLAPVGIYFKMANIFLAHLAVPDRGVGLVDQPLFKNTILKWNITILDQNVSNAGFIFAKRFLSYCNSNWSRPLAHSCILDTKR